MHSWSESLNLKDESGSVSSLGDTICSLLKSKKLQRQFLFFNGLKRKKTWKKDSNVKIRKMKNKT